MAALTSPAQVVKVAPAQRDPTGQAAQPGHQAQPVATECQAHLEETEPAQWPPSAQTVIPVRWGIRGPKGPQKLNRGPKAPREIPARLVMT